MLNIVCHNLVLLLTAATVIQLGKGKWKTILDEAGDVFKSRSQVDLKDKWRNLERQGIVQVPVKAEAASGTDGCSALWIARKHHVLHARLYQAGT